MITICWLIIAPAVGFHSSCSKPASEIWASRDPNITQPIIACSNVVPDLNQQGANECNLTNSSRGKHGSLSKPDASAKLINFGWCHICC